MRTFKNTPERALQCIRQCGNGWERDDSPAFAIGPFKRNTAKSLAFPPGSRQNLLRLSEDIDPEFPACSLGRASWLWQLNCTWCIIKSLQLRPDTIPSGSWPYSIPSAVGFLGSQELFADGAWLSGSPRIWIKTSECNDHWEQCLLQLWFPEGICPVVGLLDHRLVLFLVF